HGLAEGLQGGDGAALDFEALDRASQHVLVQGKPLLDGAQVADPLVELFNAQGVVHGGGQCHRRPGLAHHVHGLEQLSDLSESERRQVADAEALGHAAFLAFATGGRGSSSDDSRSSMARLDEWPDRRDSVSSRLAVYARGSIPSTKRDDERMTADIATLRRVLSECRSLAALGLSAHWHRPRSFA